MTHIEPKSSDQRHAEAYKLIASIRALHESNDLCAEHGAMARLENLARQKAFELGTDFVTLCQRYDAYVRTKQETHVLALIKAGHIDHAIVKFPQSVEAKLAAPVGTLTKTEAGKLIEWKIVPKPGTYSIYPAGTGPAAVHAEGSTPRRSIDRAFSILAAQRAIVNTPFYQSAPVLVQADDLLQERLHDELERFNMTEAEMWKAYDADLKSKSVPTPVDPESHGTQIATLIINNDKGHQVQRVDRNKPMPEGPYAVYAMGDAPKPTKVASVVIHKGSVEQILFNLGHGLPDGTYELVKS